MRKLRHVFIIGESPIEKPETARFQRGSNIHVVAKGLVPGEDYVSLYYENHNCELEPYSEDDIIGAYTANEAGVGITHDKLEDDHEYAPKCDPTECRL